MGFFSSIIPKPVRRFFDHGGPIGLVGGKTQDSQAAANQYLNQIPGIGHQYLDPYVQKGLKAGDTTDSHYDKLLNNPSDFINSILASYKPSEGYQFKEDRLKKAAAGTAAAGGFSGTPFDAEQQASLVNSLLSDDMQQYLGNVVGAYNRGLSGKEGIANRGFEASTNLADFLGNSLIQQGGLAYDRAEMKNHRKRELQKALLNLVTSSIGGAMGMPGAGSFMSGGIPSGNPVDKRPGSMFGGF